MKPLASWKVTGLRRLILCVSIVPLCLFAVVIVSMEAIAEEFSTLPRAVRAVWRGQ